MTRGEIESPPASREDGSRWSGLRRSAVTVILLVLAFCIGCTAAAIPLLRTPGYELALLAALLTTLIAGPLTVSVLLPVIRSAGSGVRPREALRAYGRATLFSVVWTLLLLLPAVIGTSLTEECDLAEGLAWYALLPGVTALFAPAVALFLTLLVRHPRLFYFIFVSGTILHALALGYWTPAIFSYNLFYGYFPGLTYDELLPLTGTLVLFRGCTLLFGAVLVWWSAILLTTTDPGESTRQKSARWIRQVVTPGRLPGTLAALLCACALFWFRCDLGLETNTGSLRNVLSASMTAPHCTIHYAPGSYTDGEAARIAALHEFRLSQIMKAFSLPRVERIDSYIYPSAEEKQRLIGAGVTNIAKPWSRQIHVTVQTLESTLAHELVHVVAGRFGDPVLSASTSPGLVEGMATAMEGEWGRRTHHQYAAAMRTSGIHPDIRALMRPTGFVAEASSVSYALAGSFCRYLIDRYGMRSFTTVYRTGDYRSAYGRALDDLFVEWDRFLDRFPVDAEDTDLVDALFRRPPIFLKVCPRLVARASAEARAQFQRGEYAAACARFGALYRTTGSFDALTGYASVLFRLGHFDSLRTLYLNRVVPDERPARYLALYILFGDAFLARGDTATAMPLYRRVYRVRLSDPLTEQAATRLSVLPRDSAMRWRSFFLSGGADSSRLALVDSLGTALTPSCVADYVRGILLMRLRRNREAAEILLAASQCDLDPVLHAGRLRSAGRCLLAERDEERAKAAFWESLNYSASDAEQAQMNDWIDRCSWMRATLPPEPPGTRRP